MSKEIVATNRNGLLESMAKQWGMPELPPEELYDTLKATAFKPVKKGDNYVQVTDAQFVALVIVARQYKLNPFLKEIYAFPAKDGSIVPVVGVDGWANIINSHPQMDGIEYNYSDNIVKMDGSKPCPEWIECVITRKDREKPIIIREYLDECYQKVSYTTPWQTHTKRFLRHKATIQAGRMAFGFTGIYDPDEAERIVKDVTPVSNTQIESLNSQFVPSSIKPLDPAKEPIIDAETGEILSNEPAIPVLRIPTMESDPTQADWGKWSADFIKVVDDAPSLQWISKLGKHYETQLGNLKRTNLAQYESLIKTVNEKKKELA